MNIVLAIDINSRKFLAYGVAGFFVLIAVMFISFVALYYYRKHQYDNDSLPSLIDLGLEEDPEVVEKVESAFTIDNDHDADDYDDKSISDIQRELSEYEGDSLLDVMLEEETEDKPKRKFFGKS